MLTKTSEHFWRLGDFVMILDFLIQLQPGWSNTLFQSAGSLALCKLLCFVCIPCKDGHIYNCRVNHVPQLACDILVESHIKNDGQTNLNA